MIGHIVHSNRSQTVSIESKCGDPDGEENQIDPELLGMLARVFTSIRTVLVRDEQNSLTGILLADQLRYLTNLRFGLVFGVSYEALAVERVETDRRILRSDSRAFEVGIVDVPDTPRIIERPWL